MLTKTKQKYPEAQNPLILRSHRLMEAFAKSDDERDFYLDKVEGFIVYVNLDKSEEELISLENEIEENADRYCMIPKLTFFETKKIMEGFVNEKVYDIDTKEKLLDIIQSKEAREHFLEFIYDQHSELEKWQQFYQERSRIRIIEWLRHHHFHFVFEEDLDLSTSVVEKLKENLFEKKVDREIEVARKSLATKAKTYYSNEALNPRPKRGRPPKQAQKLEMEPQITTDIYTTVPSPIRPFLFTPEISSVLDVTFSSRFETGQELLAHRKHGHDSVELEQSLNNISQKLATLRQLSSKWMEKEKKELSTTAAGGEVAEEEEEDPFSEFGEEERILFQKLEDRKKSVKSKTPIHKNQKVDKKKPISKGATKLEVRNEGDMKKTNAQSVKKRIIPMEKKSKAVANEKSNEGTPKGSRNAQKPISKGSKRPVRKILPKIPKSQQENVKKQTPAKNVKKSASDQKKKTGK
jgi:Uncharacterised protein family (UPF0158)